MDVTVVVSISGDACKSDEIFEPWIFLGSAAKKF